jgi:hypothetical protein
MGVGRAGTGQRTGRLFLEVGRGRAEKAVKGKGERRKEEQRNKQVVKKEGR